MPDSADSVHSNDAAGRGGFLFEIPGRPAGSPRATRSPVPSEAGALALLDRLDPKYRPAWEGRPIDQQAAMARYYLPHNSRKKIIAPTRPRVLKWYCPFACQRTFPTGHRYEINVYRGCSLGCEYCYIVAYTPPTVGRKRDFERQLLKDLDDLERFDVPPGPVHVSNSTDPFQPLEKRAGQARFALEQILAHRRRFTTVTILTKNPLLAVQLGYAPLLSELASLPADHPSHAEFADQELPGLRVEVSLAFADEAASTFYDVRSPSVADRMEGVRQLRAAGVPVVLRVDPLFPRSPLPGGKTLGDFGLPEAQTLGDLESLVDFAGEVGTSHVVYSTVKLVRPRYRPLLPAMQSLRAVMEHVAARARFSFKAGGWRLPPEAAQAAIVEPFLDICRGRDMPAKFCMQNVLETP